MGIGRVVKQIPELYKVLQQGKPLSEAATQTLRKTEPTPKLKAGEEPAAPKEGDVLPPEQVEEPTIRNEPDPEPDIRDQGDVSVDEAGRIVRSVGEPRPEDPTTNINFERLDSEADLDAMIDEASKINLEHGQHPPRDSLAAMEERAEGYTLKDIVGHDPVEKGIMLPEKAVAARNLLVELGERLHKQARTLAPDPTSGVTRTDITDDELVVFRQNVAKYRAVLATVEGQTRLAGQLLGSFRIPAKNTGMIRDLHVHDMLADMGGRDAAIKLADNIASQRSLKDVAKQAKMGWAKKTWRLLEQVRYSAMLSGPDTHLRNFMGNTAALLSKVVETPVVSAVGKARRAITRSPKDVAPSEDYVRGTEMLAQIMSIPAGAMDGFKLAWKSLKDPDYRLGFQKTGNDIERRFAVSNSQWAQKNPIGKTVAWLVDIAFLNGATRALQAGDNFFKAIAYQMEKSSLAVRRGMNEGLGGDELMDRIEDLMKNMPEDDYIKSIDEMHVATFTNEMEGPLIRQIRQGINRMPGGSLAVPFFGTLVNLASFSARRTPLALATPSFYRAIQKGGIAADKAIAQAIAGSVLVGLPAWQMVREKKLTGSGSFLAEETRRNWFKAGWRPNSYLGDDGKYHSISGGAPLSTVVLYFATMAELSGFIEDENVRTDFFLSGAIMFGDIIMDQTFARGISEWMDAVSNPAGWKSSALARSTAGSFSPNWLRTVRKFVDPEKREVNIGTFSQRLGAEFMNRIPGLSDNLPPAVTYFGEPPEIGYDTIMVFPESSDNEDMYLYHNLDRNGYAMKKPKPVVRVAGVNIDLNQDIEDKRGPGYAYHQYQVYLGKARKKLVEKVINSSAYQNAEWGKAGESEDPRKPNRGDMLQKAMSKAKMAALFGSKSLGIKGMEETYRGTRISELIKQERMKGGTGEVHPTMPHVQRDLERQGVRF